MLARLEHAIIRRRHGLVVAVGLLILFAAVALSAVSLVAASRRRAQMHTDPQVATVWIAGITRGSRHTLTLGTPLQAWLNAHGVTLFGNRRVLQSQYGGDPSGIELWFDYDSRLPGHPQLECHRIGETAFMDDLGQPYHGYLDFQGKTVGVYLPGYDHAAHQLFCALHWMPRRPEAQKPSVSEPMLFRIALPPAPRLLPEAADLPSGPVVADRQGVTVTVSRARLSGPKLGHFRTSQRDLTFRLRITGGEPADDNIAAFENPDWRLTQNLLPVSSLLHNFRRFAVHSNRVLYIWSSGTRAVPVTIGPSLPRLAPANPVASGHRRFTVIDPYGVSLMPNNERLTPLRTMGGGRAICNDGGVVWRAPVNAAGTGTDVIRLHLDVRPKSPAGSAPNAPRPPAIPFDLTIPVQTGGEV